MGYLVIDDDGTVTRYEDDGPLTKAECLKKWADLDCCMVAGLRAAGYEIEHFTDPSSGVLSLRLVPPLKRK